MNRVILNADDFGLSPGVNRGILSAFREGILTSTTMLVNLPSFDDAVALAHENRELPLGIHLSLLWGRPVSDPAEIPTLVDRAGRFPESLTTLARRYYLGRVSFEQVKMEFRSQIRKFVAAGLRPTHVDTHKHVHGLPRILDALISVAGELGIGKIRLPSERRPRGAGGRGPRPSWKSAAKRELLRLLCRDARGSLDRAGIKTTDHFVGIGYQDCLDARALRFILSNLQEGTTEVMCHPGYPDETLRSYVKVPLDRQRELDGLKDPQLGALAASGAIRLMHYGELE